MPSETLAKEGCRMHYVYLLENGNPEPRRYIGVTTDLKRRFAEHNAGKSIHTSKYKP
jgi:putative endonuclease